MKNQRNSKSKIENLIEAFSELTDQDLSEARAQIIAVGKDPENIVREGMEKLANIQRKFSVRKQGVQSDDTEYLIYPCLILDNLNRLLVLSSIIQQDQVLLSLQTAYQLMVENKDAPGIERSSLEVSIEIQKLKFIKIVREVKFNILIEADAARIEIYINDTTQTRISSEELRLVCRVGYFIGNNVCIPIDQDSLAFASEVLGNISTEGSISIGKALDYFGRRDKLRFLVFLQEEFDLHQIITSGMYNKQGSKFIRTLYKYQNDGLQWLLYCCINRCGGLLADDMGLGKTAQIIALTAEIIERTLLDNILIVVPTTLIENWRREFLYFAPDILPYIHHGNMRTGSTEILIREKVIITSYSMIINDIYLFNRINWGLIVLDEASLIKNPDSERRRALEKLNSNVRIAMTGTPVENSLMDLWSIGDFVRPGYFGSRTEFGDRYSVKSISGNADTSLNLLKEKVSWMMLRRKKEDVLEDLPEKINIHQAMEMKLLEGSTYNQKRLELINEDRTLGTSNYLRHIVELRMYTTHPLLREPEKLKMASLEDLMQHSNKFSRMIEILDEVKRNSEKVLIFTEFINMVDVLSRVLGKRFEIPIQIIDGRVEMEQRQLNIDVFTRQLGFGIMVLNPKTGAMGLNITAANHVIHYTRQWNPALEEQASARAYRNGQNKGVNIYYLYYVGTIEETIDLRLRAKQQLSDDVIAITETETIEQYLSAINRSPLKK